jgi:DMSO/TMAO reductase YedYZ molybdopterin-dependent catalytic subunit
MPIMATMTAPRTVPSRSADLAAAISGALAAATALAVGEIVAGLVARAPSPVIAIGDLAIDLQPPGAKEIMVDLFGTNDKLVLNLLIVVGATLIAAAVGVAARRNWNVGVGAFIAAGTVGLFAALREPLTSQVLAVATVVFAVVVGLAVLRLLLSTTNPAWAPAAASTNGTSSGGMETDAKGWDRRRFLILGSGVAVSAVAAGSIGRTLLENKPGGPEVGAQLPPVKTGATVEVPADASLAVEGITPIVMPNERFYRIDTALLVPKVDVSTWSLKLTGMVDKEVTLTYDQLQTMLLFEQFVTIACVSNDVGGNLVGNALWKGVHLRDVLAMAGVHPDASQIVGRSVDGFTVGFPTDWAMDPSRDPMIALGMNGQPLPSEHGYPARLIIPGLYGYVSATKWLSEIELTTLDAFDAYWVPKGWAKEAPILTQSRIDVPRSGASVATGPVTVAGVAWAPDRGVSAVEIKVDDGAWMPATLSTPLTKAAWVQWLVNWDATAGRHTIEARATDGNGIVQTADRTSPAPDGARGHHTISVQVG